MYYLLCSNFYKNPTGAAVSNVYTPPSADLSNSGGEDATYEPQVFSLVGRIGRLRMLAFGVVLGAATLVAALAIALLGGLLGVVALVLFGILYIPVFVLSIAYSVRRLHDLNHSGWFVLLSFVPFLNILVGLYLIFAPGTQGSNDFGPAPSPNPTWVKVCAFGIPVFVMVIGILAAIAIPAYQDYVLRASQQQNQSAQ
jgi:uncharacterized membrane protein YhaH (DUF805 family)